MQLLQLLNQPALPSLVALFLTARVAQARVAPALLQGEVLPGIVTALAARGGSSQRLHVERARGLFR